MSMRMTRPITANEFNVLLASRIDRTNQDEEDEDEEDDQHKDEEDEDEDSEDEEEEDGGYSP